MRAVRRCLVALSLLAVLASTSAVAAPSKATGKLKFPRLIQRVLDYLDSKLTVPPI